MADLLDPLDNAYTSRDLAYLKTQGFDYMLLVQGKSRQQPKVFMKSAGISVPSAIVILKSLSAPQPPTKSELTDVQKEMFPKTPMISSRTKGGFRVLQVSLCSSGGQI